MALDKGETALAEVAKRKAEQVETESIGKLYSKVFEKQESGKEVHSNLESGNDIDMHLSMITKMFYFQNLLMDLMMVCYKMATIITMHRITPTLMLTRYASHDKKVHLLHLLFVISNHFL